MVERISQGGSLACSYQVMGSLCQDGSRVHTVLPGSYMKPPTTGHPGQQHPLHKWNPGWVCEHCAGVAALIFCPDMALAPRDCCSKKNIMQKTESPDHQSAALVQPCLLRPKPWHAEAQSTAHLPSAVPSQHGFLPGRSSSLGLYSFSARVQNYDAAALESCLTSPTNSLQQGSRGFWHL